MKNKKISIKIKSVRKREKRVEIGKSVGYNKNIYYKLKN